MDDEPSEHRVVQLQKLVSDHMARLSAKVPNGRQLMVMQLCVIEMETLKDMLFGEGGPLEGRGLEHTYKALLAFDAWALNMEQTLNRARLLNGNL
jgi:hypothetical protein